MSGPIHVCQRCGLKFHSEWSEEEARAEAAKTFGSPIPEGEDAIVCDKCYTKVMEIAELNNWPKNWDMS